MFMVYVKISITISIMGDIHKFNLRGNPLK